MVAPEFAVMLVRARIVPLMVELVPIVAELVTCQNTLQADAPPVMCTLLALPKTRSDDAWKIQTRARVAVQGQRGRQVGGSGVAERVHARDERQPVELHVACAERVERRHGPAGRIVVRVRQVDLAVFTRPRLKLWQEGPALFVV